MGFKFAVGVTNETWFKRLKELSQSEYLDVVNFWTPNPGKSFQALERGELFLFKLHNPNNYIVGGGFFREYQTMPCSLAWKIYGKKNGASSEAEMRAQIAQYRRTGQTGADFQIGCLILSQPFFFGKQDYISFPLRSRLWSPNIVRFKVLNTDCPEAAQLLERVRERMNRPPEPVQDITDDETERDERWRERQRPLWEEIPERQRPQMPFRELIAEIYRGRCAVTQERTSRVLKAAYIRPRNEGGGSNAQNGLLLRRDIRDLFNGGYVTVTPDLEFKVSGRVSGDSGYRELDGRPIVAPPDAALRPDPAALRWHHDNRYRG